MFWFYHSIVCFLTFKWQLTGQKVLVTAPSLILVPFQERRAVEEASRAEQAKLREAAMKVDTARRQEEAAKRTAVRQQQVGGTESQFYDCSQNEQRPAILILSLNGIEYKVPLLWIELIDLRSNLKSSLKSVSSVEFVFLQRG